MFLRDCQGTLLNLGDKIAFPTSKYIKLKVGTIQKVLWHVGAYRDLPKVYLKEHKVWLTRTDRIVKVNG